MPKGDIVLVIFPFTDLSGSKLRPAIILAETDIDITVCFITTQLRWQEKSDFTLTPSIANGLKAPSLVRTGKIASLNQNLIKGNLGKLSSSEISMLNNKLKQLLQLP